MTENRFPTVHEALRTVGEKVGVIQKALVNADSRYNAIGVDDVRLAFHQPLIEAGVTVLPQYRLLTSEFVGERTRWCTVEGTFVFVGPAGDVATVVTIGEACDTSDKAMNQAMQAAFKYAFIQAFCIPSGEVDADSKSPSATRPASGQGFKERVGQAAGRATSQSSQSYTIRDPDAPVSDRQLGLIRGKARALGFDDERLIEESELVLDTEVEDIASLTKGQASTLIEALIAREQRANEPQENVGDTPDDVEEF